jgi:hypothetical protein
MAFCFPFGAIISLVSSFELAISGSMAATSISGIKAQP